MASAGDSQLFDESFTITTFDQSKYDRVARIGGTSADSQTVMTLDINTELYPCSVGETLHCVLASSLNLDGTKDDGRGWRDVARSGPGGETTLADMFDYVCHGKIYKFEDGEDGQTIKAYVSFGGLLMALEGPYKKLTPLRVDGMDWGGGSEFTALKEGNTLKWEGAMLYQSMKRLNLRLNMCP